MIAMNTAPSSQPFFPADDQIASAAQAPAGSLAPASAERPETVTVTAPADSDGKSFFDNLLDVVNPLEHFPIVSTIYSNLTGDKPNDFTQVAGDTLYGGPLGLLSSVGNLIFKDVTGKSVGDTVWGWVTDKSSGDTKTAANDAPRQNLKPSTDMFSFLRASVGNDYDSNSTAVASNAAPKIAAPAIAATVPVTTAALGAPVATPSSAANATPTQTASSAIATAQPRLLNPLPPRGAPPMHTQPSENVRAAGMASMIANRAHLKSPASEGNAPAMLAATPGQSTAPSQNPPQSTPVASSKPPTVSVGSDGIPTLNSNGEQALLDALNKNGISGAIGQQALMAYQKTMAMNPDPSNAAALQSATLH
jgi:hypothetical protein